MQARAIVQVLEQIVDYDNSDFAPLYLGGERIGCINSSWRTRLLAAHPELFQIQQGAVLLQAQHHDYVQRSQALAAAAQQWRDLGWLSGWRNEKFVAYLADGSPCFEMERAAFRPLGLTSRAVHLNGLVRMADGEIRMWIGRRSPFKDIPADRLDNLMGGGVAAGESIQIALEREGWEEAGIPATRLELLPQSALLLAERPVPRGLHREWLHVFDLWLQPGELPANQDGEVAEHLLLSLAEVEQHLINGQFMSDAALVAIDCLARLAYWPQHDGLQTLLQRIRAPLGSDRAVRRA